MGNHILCFSSRNKTRGLRERNCYEREKYDDRLRLQVALGWEHIWIWNVIKVFVLLLTAVSGAARVMHHYNSIYSQSDFTWQSGPGKWYLITEILWNKITWRPKYKKFLIVAPTQLGNTHLWVEYVARLWSFQQLFRASGCVWIVCVWLLSNKMIGAARLSQQKTGGKQPASSSYTGLQVREDQD